ncbi:MAG: hypothetical protein WBQ44_14970 [Rhodococcus sp. (in: high G+C Gram-positive bacteria)]
MTSRSARLSVLLQSARLSVLLLCALLSVGCGVTSGPESTSSAEPTSTSESASAANPYEEQRRAGVETLLAQWAEAIRNDDADAIREVMDPSAPPEFVQSELRRAAALTDVPLDDWGYELVDEPETPVPSSVATPLDAADVWAPSVVLRYAVTGPDTESTTRPVSLLVAKRGDRWRIVSDTEIPGIDRRTWKGPWDFGPVTATSVQTSGGTSVVLGHPAQSALVARLVAELPSAVAAVTEFYGSEWPRKTLLIAAGSPAEFAASGGSVAAGTDVAAVTVSDVVSPDVPVTGQRVIFSPVAQERLDEFSTRSVLRHELTHVAARTNTVDGSPTWILEGFADYAGYRGSGADFGRLAPTLARVVAAGGPPTVLPEDSDFTAGGVRSTLAYESAWSVCAYVAEQFGEPALRTLYGLLATGPRSATEIDEALRATTGANASEFVTAWGSWVLRRSR